MTDTEMVHANSNKVWVLVVDHKHGTNVTACPSRKALDAEMHSYCDLSWPMAFTEPRPADEELVERYWERQADRGDEWYRIEECEVAVSLAPGLNKAMEIVGNMRQSEAGLFDAAHSGQRGADRSAALYDAYAAIRGATIQQQ